MIAVEARAVSARIEGAGGLSLARGMEVVMDRDVDANRQPAADAEDRDWELEARLIAEAEAEADAGLLIPFEEVEAWLNSLDTDNPLPKPQARPLRR
jgi:predicted transcriptional regulator